MCTPRFRRAHAIGLILVIIMGSAALAWYATTRDSASQHFDSCRFTADGQVSLRYTYGVGDQVTTSFVSRKDAIVVSLDIDRADGPQPAIALQGESRFQAGGVDQSVEHEDGTGIECSTARSGEAP